MKNVKALSISSIVSIAFITIITIVAEMVKPLKDGLAAMTGHHWVTKSIIGMLLFIILAIILGYTTKADNKNSAKFIWGTFWTTIGGSLALLIYFVIHTFA
ncbi:MAG: hypothetical protein KJ770_02495 [Actinobacteria bacterium]|nr:hypothetical protein [Actinomycetota bacterium]MCG2789693.1 hypothetical protein [Actinomycetes bacterium]